MKNEHFINLQLLRSKTETRIGRSYQARQGFMNSGALVSGRGDNGSKPPLSGRPLCLSWEQGTLNARDCGHFFNSVDRSVSAGARMKRSVSSVRTSRQPATGAESRGGGRGSLHSLALITEWPALSTMEPLTLKPPA